MRVDRGIKRGPKKAEIKYRCHHCKHKFSAGNLVRHQKAHNLPVRNFRIIRQCKWCGDDFETVRSRVNPECCSKSCLALYHERIPPPCDPKVQSERMKERFRLDASSNPFYGRTPTNYKGWGLGGYVEELGFSVRSSWEKDYLLALKTNHILFAYEPHRVDLGDCTYLPDILIKRTNFYIEIIGIEKETRTAKMEKFIDLYDVRLYVVRERPSEASMKSLVKICKEVISNEFRS